ADDVPTGDIDGCGDANECFPCPTSLMRQALRGQGEQLLLQSFRRARIHAQDLLGHAFAKCIDDLSHACVARREAEHLDTLTRAHAHEELAGSRRYKVADPMGAATFWGTQDERFEMTDLLSHLLAPMVWRGSICAMIGARTPGYDLPAVTLAVRSADVCGRSGAPHALPLLLA